MVVSATAALQCACDVCGLQPCPSPGFCRSCRAADACARQQRTTQNGTRPTPRSTIEAIMWCVHERGLGALHEHANIERLVRCDDGAKTEINQRIARLIAAKEIAA